MAEKPVPFRLIVRDSGVLSVMDKISAAVKRRG